MKKFRYMSDLHLESNHIDFPVDEFNVDETLLLIGDIVGGQKVWDSKLTDNVCELILWADKFHKTIWVPGNHEYNNFSSMDECHRFFRKMISDCGAQNVLFSPFGTEVMDDVVVLWATLWTNFNNDVFAKDACKNFYDFKSNDDLTPDYVSVISDLQINYIGEAARKYKSQGKKVLVATHFPPSQHFANSRGTLEDAYFYRNCEFWFDTVDVWLYGHSHYNKTFEREGLFIGSNQLGYGHEGKDFSENRKIKL